MTVFGNVEQLHTGNQNLIVSGTSGSYAASASAATSITFLPASASFAHTDWSAINNIPISIVSSSAQILADLTGTQLNVAGISGTLFGSVTASNGIIIPTQQLKLVGNFGTTTPTGIGQAVMGTQNTIGLILAGAGSTSDVRIFNGSGSQVIDIPAGSTNTTFAGTMGVNGSGNSGGAAISVDALPFYQNTVGSNILMGNSAGVYYGGIGNISADLWALGYSSAPNTLITPVLHWDDGVGVTISGSVATEPPQTLMTGSVGGFILGSQPFVGGTLKVATVSWAATFTGNATYTFPVPFIFQPTYIVANSPSPVTSLSPTSITVTGNGLQSAAVIVLGI